MTTESAQLKRTVIAVTAFAIAMGLLEAVVAYYLRLLYYPQGFLFPLKFIPHSVLSAELLREAATIFMLIAVGIISGKNNVMRFLYFLFAFGIWDIVYYLGLKLLLNWPQSLLTWDILFLVPLPWASPVLAPVICSLTMILFFSLMIHLRLRDCEVTIKVYEWLLLISGSLLILYTFIYDYGCMAVQYRAESGKGQLSEAISQFVPDRYNWFIFTLGEAIILCAVILIAIRVRRMQNS